MKKHLLIAAGLSALVAATPAAAQDWTMYRPTDAFSREVDDLRYRIDESGRRGQISRAEERRLEDQLWDLQYMRGVFSANGLSSRERDELGGRLASLRRRLADADRYGSAYGRDDVYDRDDSFDRGDWDARDDRDDRYEPDRPVSDWDSDRWDDRSIEPATSGALLGIGDPAPSGLNPVPPEYRDLYRDDNLVYYRYDNGRLYQIDRAGNRIRWIGELPR